MVGATPQIAIIGADMEGLTGARALNERGLKTVIFDRQQLSQGKGHWEIWLTADWAEAKTLQQPLPDGALIRVR